MSLLKEFRDFAMRGNVVDLAVGVVIGAGFGKIISSFVDNIIMPPINLLTAKSGVNFKEAAIKQPFTLPKKGPDGKEVLDTAGQPVMETVNYAVLNYGPFIQTVFEFTLMAFAIFMAVKLMNSVKARAGMEAEAAPPPPPPEDVILLREIRDSLKR